METIRSNDNSAIPWLLRATTVVEMIVLVVAGLSLYLLPGWTRDVWPWEITPFNTRFLGSIYLASLVSVASLTLVARRAPVRLVVPMIVAFTTVILVVSIVYTDRFEDRFSTIAWWIIFIVTPPGSAYFAWHFRKIATPLASETPRSLSRFLFLEGLVTGIYGILLLVAPTWSTAFWPWPIDDFHGRLYSAVFVTLAVGSLLVLRRGAPNELATLGATQLTLGLTAIAGFVIVDADVQKVDWSAVGTWIWIGGFALILLEGFGLTASGLAERRLGARVSRSAAEGS